jgi:tRNA (cytidine/uridine-2'-O-)-methyltransferase
MSIKPRRLILWTANGRRSAYSFSFVTDDVFLFGKESAGVLAATVEACDPRLRLPLRPEVRSMNLAAAATLALGEALRQTGSLPAG